MKRILYLLIIVLFATNADIQAQCNLNLTTQTNNTCTGDSNGRVIVNVGGGMATYSYVWSNSSSTTGVTSTSDTIDNLTAGTYTVNVTDGNSCTASITATIALVPVPASPTGVSATSSSICPGDSSNLTAIGANANDSIKWYDAMTAGTLLNTMISGGNYNVTPASTQIYYAEAHGTIGNSQTFGFTGAVDSFIVPAGVTNIDITAMGAQGGNPIDVLPTNATGGLGGSVTGSLAVTQGQVIYITVGGQGDTAGVGGFNGGGAGGNALAGASCFGGYGGGGGGASDIRIGANTLAARVAVAAGGGGAGRDYCNGTCQPCGCGGGGGGAGGATGVDGIAAFDCGFAYPGSGVNGGKGASQTAGGAGGTGDGAGNSGTAGTTGVGGIGADGDYDIAGGGGGGGYYGGGAGGGADDGSGVAAGGGGGGSSYIGGLTAASTAAGVQTGNGSVTISWETPGGCPSARVATTVTVITIDKTVTVSGRTITSNEAGPATYQWLNNAAVIGGATNVSYTVPNADNGNFTVAITKNGCEETSDVTMLFPLGLSSLENEGSISIYPNPVIDELSIKSETPLVGIELYNSLGKVVLTATPNNLTEYAMDLSPLASGNYFIRITDQKGNFVLRKLSRK